MTPEPFTHVWDCRCLFCGRKEFVRLVEIWSTHEFQLETCCEGTHVAMAAEMAEDPDFAKHIMQLVHADEALQSKIRRVAFTDDGCGPVLLDCELQVRPAEKAFVDAFIAQHHAHNAPLKVDRFRAAIFNGNTVLGVVQVGNPCARAFNGRGIVEVRRLCLDRSIPDALRWKACSTGYMWAAEEAERLGWSKVITYTLASETGMSMRYARWKCEGAASRAGHSWLNRHDRTRRVDVPAEAKVRWAKELKPSAMAVASLQASENKRAKLNARRASKPVQLDLLAA